MKRGGNSRESDFPDDTVHIWATGLHADVEALRSMKTTLSSDELKRAARFVRSSDRDTYIVARSTLRRILSRYLHLAPEAVQFAYNEFGKPCLAGGEVRSNLHFNVSHSGSAALFAFCAGYRLGIDLERIQPDCEWESIAKHCFAPMESRRLFSLSAKHRLRAFFLCWARKEAYAKATGKGLSLELDRFEVPVGLNVPQGKVRSILQAPDEPEWWVQDISFGPGYAAALAVESVCPGVEYRAVEWLRDDQEFRTVEEG